MAKKYIITRIHRNLNEHLRVGHESRGVDDGGGGLELDALAPALNVKHS